MTVKTKLKKITSLAVLIVTCLAVLVGCEYQPILGEYRFLQPDKTIAKPEQAQINWIIQNMGELDKADDGYANATKPSPQDLSYVDEDYIIGPRDQIRITVMDLHMETQEAEFYRQVSDSGYIALPQLDDRIKASGLDSVQLVEKIKEAYSETRLVDPDVSVSVIVRRKQSFSILGAVARPGTYEVPRKDMRLLDALAMVGGVYDPKIETIYVIRQVLPKGEAPAKPPNTASQPAHVIRKGPAVVASRSQRPQSIRPELLFQMSETATTASPTTAPAATTQATEPAAAAPAVEEADKTQPQPRWVFRNGEWVKIVAEKKTPETVNAKPDTSKKISGEDGLDSPPIPAPPVVPEASPKKDSVSEEDVNDPFQWAKIQKTDQVRVIAINLQKLEQGVITQNVVIRSNDIIQVPPSPQGEFYVMGEVLRPGVYSLTGRKVTVKMAMAAAGNLGPMAWPANSILIRRIGKNQEQTFPINLEKIMRGTDADMYLKENDIIAVGTHWSTSFLAVLRNAFRMTYGFGFIYDRNFSDPMFVSPNSKRFKAW